MIEGANRNGMRARVGAPAALAALLALPLLGAGPAAPAPPAGPSPPAQGQSVPPAAQPLPTIAGGPAPDLDLVFTAQVTGWIEPCG